MRDPNVTGKYGRAWDSKATDCYLPALWFINLPDFHPMLQWFSVAVANESEEGWQDAEIYVHILDPESYLFQEPDVDRWREQKIQMLPDAVLKHQIPKTHWATSDTLVYDLVHAFTSGDLKPDEDNREAMHNFLVNLEKWK